MIHLNRSDAPQELVDNYERWNERFVARRAAAAAANQAAPFFWNSVNGTPINQILRPIMINDTDGHCSYCDNYPLEHVDRTIDHFLPKSVYPQEAYTWENLYLACLKCQDDKGILESPLLLRPDALDYQFDSYFIVDYITFEVKPNLLESNENQEKAQKTIEILNLNSLGLCTSRRHQFERVTNADIPIEDFAFRYLF